MRGRYAFRPPQRLHGAEEKRLVCPQPTTGKLRRPPSWRVESGRLQTGDGMQQKPRQCSRALLRGAVHGPHRATCAVPHPRGCKSRSPRHLSGGKPSVRRWRQSELAPVLQRALGAAEVEALVSTPLRPEASGPGIRMFAEQTRSSFERRPRPLMRRPPEGGRERNVGSSMRRPKGEMSRCQLVRPSRPRAVRFAASNWGPPTRWSSDRSNDRSSPDVLKFVLETNGLGDRPPRSLRPDECCNGIRGTSSRPGWKFLLSRTLRPPEA